MNKISSIGIFASSSALKQGEEDLLRDSIKMLEDQGLKVYQAKNLFDGEELIPGSESFFAGNKNARLSSLMDLWLNPQVDCLMSMRGGYGVMDILPELDYQVFGKIPKPIFAYSDLTALFMAIYQKSYCCKSGQSPQFFHSPMLIELTSLDHKEKNALLNIMQSIDLDAYQNFDFRISAFSEHKILGGNLSMLAALLGTEYLPDFHNGVVFLEEVAEPAYKVDRMIKSLELAGKFNNIKELWLGQGKNAEFNMSHLQELASQNNFTIKQNLGFGHARKFTLALG